MSEPIIYKSASAVATITLNRPERLNAVNRELADALVQALGVAATDPSVRAIILTGSGKAFCAGGDIEDLAQGTMFPKESDRTEKIAILRAQTRSAELLTTMPKLTIAQITGACTGAGLSLASACDVRYCANDATFSTSFLTMGLSGDHGGAWTLTRTLGSARARELFLLSQKFDAAVAERIGFVAQAVSQDSLPSFVQAKAAIAAAFAPEAFARAKANLNAALTMELPTALDLEAQNQIDCLAGETVNRAADAFLQRRRESRPR